MIPNFTDHSANERTFLAWVRTGIAVIAFGFVIEKFNVFLLVMTSTASAEVGNTIRTERLTGPIGRYEGLAFMVIGVVLIGMGYWRFVRMERLIEDAAHHAPGGVKTEIIITAILVVLVAAYCASIVIR